MTVLVCVTSGAIRGKIPSCAILHFLTSTSQWNGLMSLSNTTIHIIDCIKEHSIKTQHANIPLMLKCWMCSRSAKRSKPSNFPYWFSLSSCTEKWYKSLMLAAICLHLSHSGVMKCEPSGRWQLVGGNYSTYSCQSFMPPERCAWGARCT